MATWSNRRKFLFATIAVIFPVALIASLFFLFFYKAPSCFDNSRNGDEQGIDCGGSCRKLCASSFLPIPSPAWVRYREIAPNLYNIAAYVINPNRNAGAKNIPYDIIILDKNGFEIARSGGRFNLPVGRDTLVFVAGVRITKQLPARAMLEINKDPDWFLGTDPLSNLDVTDKNYRESSTESSLDVTIYNRSLVPIRNTIVYAILRDKDNNVIDYSKTTIDEIMSQKKSLAPFTWPYSHINEVISIDVLTVPE